uniref:CN hydrolase domain-containing protein n=2 Tax=Photinus pyralis TaxID=7054 RepID=A0A1Y1L082_PHOPY
MQKSKMTWIVILFYLQYKFWGIHADYTAAVVEYFPEQDRHLSPEERLSKNINGYIQILDQLNRTSKLDIVVYPEATLSENALVLKHADLLPYTVEVAVNDTSLCHGPTTTFLTSLSCAAIKYQTYIALNLYERTPCSGKECPADGWSFYNTDVVLNRKGAIISKYRKYNLFGEIFMTRPEKPDISIFRTDFNETFATFICFDIMFRKPSLDLVTQYGVKSILFSSMWFSEMPFLTALQTQQHWAYATNSTLLASGANDRQKGSGGSGIYQGAAGPLVFAIVGADASKGLVAKVPGAAARSKDTRAVDRKAKEMDEFRILSDNLKPYTSKLVLRGNNNVDTSVCSGANETHQFCCHFQLELEWQAKPVNDDKKHYQYHMVAFSGTRTFARVSNGGIEVCAVVACLNDSLSSCGKRFRDYNTVSWPTTFKKIVIEAEFDEDPNKFQFPNSLLSNIEPIHVDDFEWRSILGNKRVRRTYLLKKPQNRLMTFGIYGRDFNRDSLA